MVSLGADRWVTIQGQIELWLPPNYQPSSSTVKDGIIAFGNASGRVAIIASTGKIEGLYESKYLKNISKDKVGIKLACKNKYSKETGIKIKIEVEEAISVSYIPDSQGTAQLHIM